MRRRILIGGILASAGILAAGVESAVSHTTSVSDAEGATGSTTSGAGTGTGTGTNGSVSTGTGTGTENSGSSGTGSSATLEDGTYTGDTETTQFGNMQVQITVSAGKITAVTPLQLTDREQRSVQISEYAAPILQQEALAAQSADIDTVSGATYTSDGYIRSLQSAIDQAQR